MGTIAVSASETARVPPGTGHTATMNKSRIALQGQGGRKETGVAGHRKGVPSVCFAFLASKTHLYALFLQFPRSAHTVEIMMGEIYALLALIHFSSVLYNVKKLLYPESIHFLDGAI